MINVQDIKGQWVIISPDEIMRALSKVELTLYGMDLKTINALRRNFHKNTGVIPSSAEVVDKYST